MTEKTEQDYMDILADLAAANKNTWMEPPLLAVVSGILAPEVAQQAIDTAFEVIAEGGNRDQSLAHVPISAMVMMFQFGRLFGRHEAAELLGD